MSSGGTLLAVLLLGSVVPGDDGVEMPLSAAWWDASGVSAARSLQGALLDAIPAPVFYKDLSGRYLGVNRAFAEFQDYPAEAFVDKTVCDVAPSELAEQYHAKDLELFRDGRVQVYVSQMWNAPDSFPDAISAFQEVLETGRAYRELGFATGGEPRGGLLRR